MKCSRRVSDFTKRVGALKGAFGEIQEGLKEGFKEAFKRASKDFKGGFRGTLKGSFKKNLTQE